MPPQPKKKIQDSTEKPFGQVPLKADISSIPTGSRFPQLPTKKSNKFEFLILVHKKETRSGILSVLSRESYMTSQ